MLRHDFPQQLPYRVVRRIDLPLQPPDVVDHLEQPPGEESAGRRPGEQAVDPARRPRRDDAGGEEEERHGGAERRGDELPETEETVGSVAVSHRHEHLALYAQDPKAICLIRLAWVELWTGDADRAKATARSALELAVDLDHLMTLWYVITYAAIFAAESEDLARLAVLLRDAELLWKRLPMPYLMIVGDALRGWLDVCERSPGGIEKIVRSAERSRTDGETLHLTYTLLLLARARAMAGDYHQGRAATREGLSRTHRCDQRYLEAELWRLDGELAYRSGEREAAAASLRRAVEVAAAQGAGWLELRALNSFASRFPDQTVREQLRNLMATIPSGHNLPAFRAATHFLSESG